ncbi:ABC transporter ATP-binding protein [Frankia sp. CNm7]|uniref:ABC transporter ATP-binding protein n=1 Tax=Frankia nepalensis TaxID=1836974 RepID=A0A937RHC1_9ACTN|nr:ABC transporter ATP-binding protein [Frankia nepalensis]MBL7499038.1 ABC transporter ATP-binding protein [Frankia nepalensis]MBL7510180.1 ABC transporter ATP-binding protein [Frankia nepalensis]MBL7523154.1 ABC transporter ATP-binding protein [Frankia nepalensis]MBL7626036.1 ABC transporter ATP-binding protein [Frankia nepalensis]
MPTDTEPTHTEPTDAKPIGTGPTGIGPLGARPTGSDPSAATHRWPLMDVMWRPGAGRLALLLTVLGALAQHGFAVVAGAIGGWLIGAAASGRPAADLTGWIVALAVAVVVSVVGTWANGQFGHAFAFRHQAALRLRVFDGLERGAPREPQGKRTGDLAAVAMGDVEALEGFLAHLAPTVAVAVTVGTGSLIALGLIHPALAGIAAAGMVATAVLPVFLARRGQSGADGLRGELGALNADVVDGVQGLRELVVFRQVDAWWDRLRRRTQTYKRHQLAHSRAVGLQAAATDSLVSVTTVAVLITVVGLAADHTISLAAATAAVTLEVAALAVVVETVAMAGMLAPLRASASRVLAIIDQPAQIADTATTTPTVTSARIRFDDVTFGYEPGRQVLSRASFEVAPGEMVALVGRSGAGKSTCVNLLLRFWDPAAGRITIDEHDLRDFPLAELRRLIAVIPQDVYLFDGTVADNLRLARPAASADELERAARAANAHDFIAALPGGYDTPVGERGALLSGGQRQRLAIARALLRDSPILVMDEAASNLDTENERAIQNAVRAARQGRTTVVIAHRLSTIRGADRVVVLEDGQAAEVGTHDHLLAQGGRYAAIIASQLEA